MNDAQHRLFSEIRSLLQRTPSAQVWDDLCEYVSHWRDSESFKAAALPYIVSHLDATWPDYLRVVPTRWRDALVRGIELPWTSMVRALDASEMRLKKADMLAVSHAPVFKLLTHLSLRGNRLNADAMTTLLDTLTPGRLTYLNVSDTPLGDDGATQLAAHKSLWGLDRLDLTHTRLTSVGMLACVASPVWENLQTLNVGWNPEVGQGDIALALERATITPRHLIMRGAGLTPIAFAAMAESPLLMGISELDISDNQVGYRGCVSIARSPWLSHLTDLWMSNTQVGEAGIERLMRPEQTMGLYMLDLSRNRLNDEVIYRWVDEEKRLFNMYTLNLSCTGVSVAALSELCLWRPEEQLILAPDDLTERECARLQHHMRSRTRLTLREPATDSFEPPSCAPFSKHNIMPQ